MLDSDSPASEPSGLILVVEDDQWIRESFVELLEMDGYRTLACRDGHEALEQLQRGSPPNLVLLDMLMPRMDGPTFLAELSKRPAWSGIPVIVVSATEAPAATGQVIAVLRKPFAANALLQLLRAHLPAARIRA